MRYGVEGTTLDQVAKQAGLARPLIRHNVGNRDDLLAATMERFVKRSEEATRAFIDALPAEGTLETMIEWLFDPSEPDSRTVLLSSALIAAGANDPGLAGTMRQWTRDFVQSLAEVVRKARPGADEGAVEAVAAGIASAYFTAESVTPIGPMSDLRGACRQAADRLAGTLPSTAPTAP